MTTSTERIRLTTRPAGERGSTVWRATLRLHDVNSAVICSATSGAGQVDHDVGAVAHRVGRVVRHVVKSRCVIDLLVAPNDEIVRPLTIARVHRATSGSARCGASPVARRCSPSALHAVALIASCTCRRTWRSLGRYRRPQRRGSHHHQGIVDVARCAPPPSLSVEKRTAATTMPNPREWLAASPTALAGGRARSRGAT